MAYFNAFNSYSGRSFTQPSVEQSPGGAGKEIPGQSDGLLKIVKKFYYIPKYLKYVVLSI